MLMKQFAKTEGIRLVFPSSMKLKNKEYVIFSCFPNVVEVWTQSDFEKINNKIMKASPEMIRFLFTRAYLADITDNGFNLSERVREIVRDKSFRIDEYGDSFALIGENVKRDNVKLFIAQVK